MFIDYCFFWIAFTEWAMQLNYCILEDPGAVSGGGKKSKRARKKIGRRKVKNENRSPWDSTLNRPVPKPCKILACDWAQKYFCAQSESSSFRVTFVTSYSNVFTAKFFDRLFAIYLLARAGEFPSVEKCHWNENHETEIKPPNLACL